MPADGRAPITGLAGVPTLIVLSVIGAASVAAWTRGQRYGWSGFLGA
jgi:hypothetical protein